MLNLLETCAKAFSVAKLLKDCHATDAPVMLNYMNGKNPRVSSPINRRLLFQPVCIKKENRGISVTPRIPIPRELD